MPSRRKRPARPADPADFLRKQRPCALAVELREPGERHVPEVHVEAQDRCVGHQEVHLARRAPPGRCGCGLSHYHHRRAAALADGDRVDLAGREGDHGGVVGSSRRLLGPSYVSLEKRSRVTASAGQEAPDQRRHRRRRPATWSRCPRREQALGEDMAALRVGAELNLVDRQELHLAGERHRLDRADEAAPRRDDLLLAGQRHRPGPARRSHPGRRFPAPAAAAADRSCPRRGRASARPPSGSCRCWWDPEPRRRAAASKPSVRPVGRSLIGPFKRPKALGVPILTPPRTKGSRAVKRQG